MIVALIVVVAIAILTLNAYVAAKMLRRLRAAGDYGTFPVPGETRVALSRGTLKLTYHESRRAATIEDGDIDFGVPGGLKVVVTSPSGQELPITGPGLKGIGSSLSTGPRFSRALIGTVDAPEAGVYTVSATTTGGLHGAVEPQILLGRTK